MGRRGKRVHFRLSSMKVRTMVVGSLTFSALLSVLPLSFSLVDFVDGSLHLDVYVVALDGVEARAVDNMSRVVEGVQWAVSSLHREGYKYFWSEEAHLGTVNAGGNYTYWEPRLWGLGYAKLLFPVNVTVHTVSDWEVYKTVIETAGESIVINAHGEILPVPSGYTREMWIDKIAERMLYHNLTWTHVGGYPFYYYWHQIKGFGEWGEQGFQQLMKHVDRGNVTCQSPNPNEKDGLSPHAADVIVRGPWFSSLCRTFASRNYPLKEIDFEGILAMNIWGNFDYFPGAVVAFKKSKNQLSHGFYVHIGTLQTFVTDEKPDRDYYRARTGTVFSLWAVLGRSVAEYKLAEAGAAIMRAEEDGRTAGLEDAYDLLNQAQTFYDRYFYNEGTIVYTYRAIVKAEEAHMPPQPPTPALVDLLGFSLIVGVILGSVLLWKKKNFHKSA